ncbi:OLC1v1035918C1 [Oldenlandia corymbosa var. corymbosa]|uniref:OLC1v1035918C1 n=1 Tax=Oldenlandia corymbosa var. corymbosa TaxID=529605 RepID=A0AAV1CV77_OLDCO|nr:OLC1v1035918C1 [Oldenlandia corymbosa var. corymbosa]
MAGVSPPATQLPRTFASFFQKPTENEANGDSLIKQVKFVNGTPTLEGVAPPPQTLVAREEEVHSPSRDPATNVVGVHLEESTSGLSTTKKSIIPMDIPATTAPSSMPNRFAILETIDEGDSELVTIDEEKVIEEVFVEQ